MLAKIGSNPLLTHLFLLPSSLPELKNISELESTLEWPSNLSLANPTTGRSSWLSRERDASLEVSCSCSRSLHEYAGLTLCRLELQLYSVLEVRDAVL